MTKTCKGPLCNGIERAVEDFGNNKRMKDGLQAICKPCKKEEKRVWREANRDKTRAHARAWQENNPEKRVASQKTYRDNHAEEISANRKDYYAKHRDRVTASTQKWRADNPEAVREWNANRRALKKERTRNPVMRGYWKSLLDFYGNPRCMNPECKAPEAKASLDHVVALENGGWHEWANWQVLCTVCNSSKQDLHHTDYRPYPRLVERNIS